MVKLNIGSGFRKKEGWINLDIDPSVEPDKVWDVTWGLPYEDDSVEEFFLSHVLEHITKDEIIILARELWRVGKKGAIINIVSPYWNHVSAHDVDHKSIITPRTFAPFVNGRSVESFERYHLGKFFFKQLEAFEDVSGVRHSEPQIYITLGVVK